MSDIPIIPDSLHVPKSKDDDFYLLGAGCSICGYVCFPPKLVCVKCLRDDSMKRIKLSPFGILETFAVMQIAPPGFTAPYIIGYVKLDNGPLVFTLITQCEARNGALEIGEKMELVIEKIGDDKNGNDIVGWKFRPAKKSNDETSLHRWRRPT